MPNHDIQAGYSSGGKASDCRMLSKQMVPGSMPGGRLLSFNNTMGDIHFNAATYTLRLRGPEDTHHGARTHDHKVKGLALCRLS